MVIFRTKKTAEKYKKYLKSNKEIGCALCNRKAIKAFKHWKIIKNDFPYDKIAKEHHMIVPLRHITEDSLSEKELSELQKIKKGFIVKNNYHYIMEGTKHAQTQPEHFHLHLIKLKP